MAKAETKLAPDVPDVTLNTKVERTEVGHARPNTPNAKPEPQDAMIEDDAQSTTDEILSPPMPGTPVRPSTPVGWLGWLGWGGEVPTGDATLDPESATEEQIPQLEEAAPATVPAPMEEDPAFPAQLQTVGGGWLDYWWSAPTSVPSDVQTADAPASDAPTVEIATIVPEADTKPASAPKLNLEEDTAMEDDPATKPTARAPSAGSTWAFWSRDTGPKDPEDPKDSGTSTPREPGEIAVIGEGSEMHPKAVDRKEIDPLPRPVRGKKIPKKDLKKTEPKEDEAKKEDLKTTDLKTAEAKTPDEEVAKDKEPAIPIEGKRLKNKRTRNGASVDLDQRPTTPSDLPLVPAEPAKPVTTTDTLSPVKQTPPNILLPSFASTYTVKENTSITRQIGRLILNSSTVSILGATSATSSAPSAHIFRTKTPLRIRRAVAIGVHGLFPSSYLRPMIGQPTGTSLRFAGLCADGIRRWADANGSPDCAIEKVALEGEGRIADRVDNLWKLLLNWIEHLRQADLILVACHSQGVPVGIMLLAKLIDLGIITHARIGVCAMAGVSLGPFPYRTASMLGGSAAELLEFANPQSEVSQRYEQALREILAYGARITYIGSIDDQLVPLEVSIPVPLAASRRMLPRANLTLQSAVHSPLHHPYIYRAVFIDGRIHAPDLYVPPSLPCPSFSANTAPSIAHLIGFALKLRNLGISDHGLVRELSSPLAGSLYTGEGHSRIYFDSQVYDLAITHTLETTDVPRNTEPEIRRPASGVVGVANANPYHLPWIMRGLLEEDRVKTELSDETAALLRKYDDWNPVTAKLKEVKYKLEAIRSHL